MNTTTELPNTTLYNREGSSDKVLLSQVSARPSSPIAIIRSIKTTKFLALGPGYFSWYLLRRSARNSGKLKSSFHTSSSNSWKTAASSNACSDFSASANCRISKYAEWAISHNISRCAEESCITFLVIILAHKAPLASGLNPEFISSNPGKTRSTINKKEKQHANT